MSRSGMALAVSGVVGMAMVFVGASASASPTDGSCSVPAGGAGGDTGGGGGAYGNLPDLSHVLQQAQASGFVTEVPPAKQTGNTCGFFALQMSTSYWNPLYSCGRAPEAGQAALGGELTFDSQGNLVPDGMQPKDSQGRDSYIGDEEWNHGYAGNGVTFGNQLADVGRDFGYNANNRQESIDSVRDSVDAGIPVIALMSVGKDGQPVDSTADGHWVVIEGFYTDPKSGEQFVIAKHGWSDQDYIWPLSQFQQSFDREGDYTVTIAPHGVTSHSGWSCVGGKAVHWRDPG